jgi:cytochrome c oxidase subunit 1
MAYFFRGLISALAAFFAVTLALGVKMPAQAAETLGYLAGLLAFLCGVGGWESFWNWLRDKEEIEPHDWRRYFRFTTDHKVIGVQYIVISLVVFIVAGIMALMMRAELSKPSLQFLTNDSYNTVMGLHGIGMIVVALIAIVGGLGNYVIPLSIGAKDMAFPRLNALSFWLLPSAVVILLSSALVGGFDFGWTAYPPLSTKGPDGKLFFVLAFVTVGFSSIFGGVNLLTTIFRLRTKGMGLFKMPIFAWSILSASVIIVLATSVVASALLMVVFDRVLGTSFFDPSKGGSALLYPHLFWFYSHPAVYIMILPAFGVLLEILPVYARKPLFAYSITAVSLIGIVILSFIVWAHHLFTVGMWDGLSIPFMITTELISVPTAVVFLSALGTLWAGRMRLQTPMLFALGILFNFLIGGLTGIFLADVPTDLHLHSSWFVMAHFHYTIVGGAVFAFFAGLYHWFPKITGRMFNETLGKIHFWLFMIGFNATFLPMFWLGTHGMRRRVADYPAEFAPVQLWISLVTLIVVISVIVFLYNVISSWLKGGQAPANPWDAKTLEWQTASPPPQGNFERAPAVPITPYEYGKLPV